MKPCTINGRYRFILPDHLADWDALSMWEQERTESMEAHLTGSMVLYDVGSEHGAQSACYASFCGPENIVLIEPTTTFWPNLRLIWEHNGFHAPLATSRSLIGTRNVEGPDSLVIGGWPSCAEGDEQPARSYTYIHEPGTWQGVAQWRLDSLWHKVGAKPDAITIDVEGAELLVLEGAVSTLKLYKPLVWVSVHPDLMERDYGVLPHDLYEFMESVDYAGELLAIDHEHHWFFTPRKPK